ncbi:unnamed protein product, partial [Mesorhabditis belari]|uniref:Uncharacterized protein n=1 Tax=Mesorhabditis belari TaxID=2138241 RepID=A0AAF3FPW3_9BILA
MLRRVLVALMLSVFLDLVLSQCTEKYTPWLLRGTCTDTCGGYGQQKMVRLCATGCTCTGDLVQYVQCGDTLCAFPRATCNTISSMKKVLVGATWVCGFQKGQ